MVFPCWNDWKNGLYYLQQNKSLYSIQVLLNDMLRDVQALKSGMDAAAAAEITANMPSTGIKMAIAVVGVLPVLIVCGSSRGVLRYANITIGAVKEGDLLINQIFFANIINRMTKITFAVFLRRG